MNLSRQATTSMKLSSMKKKSFLITFSIAHIEISTKVLVSYAANLKIESIIVQPDFMF